MKAINFKEMTNAAVTAQELIDTGLFGTLKTAVKWWGCQDEFRNSEEVKEVYSGFQKEYDLSNKCTFKGGFMTEGGKVFEVYEALGVTLVRQLTISSSLHNGGCYEMNFIMSKDEKICYTVNDSTAYDMQKVRAHQKKIGKQLQMTFVDVYASTVL